MKHAKIVALVLSLHLFVVAALLVQPGCKTYSPSASDTVKSRSGPMKSQKTQQEQTVAQLPRKRLCAPCL